MNREWKRKMRHDKKLVKELFEIIQKYFPELLDKFANLSDIVVHLPKPTIFNNKLSNSSMLETTQIL